MGDTQGAIQISLYMFTLCCVFPQLFMSGIMISHVSLAKNANDLIVFS